jgi:protein-S-isoprenylcysteine O-methyltransferase Ste14
MRPGKRALAYAIVASCLVVLLAAGIGYAIAAGHVYWLVYLCWIGAVPAIVFLGLLMTPPAGTTAGLDPSRLHSARSSGNSPLPADDTRRLRGEHSGRAKIHT